MLEQLEKEIIEGRRLKRGDDLSFLLEEDLDLVCHAANHIRQALCGDGVSLCSIINGRSGRCSEDCKFCAQSTYYHTGIEEYTFLDEDRIFEDCKKHEAKGVHRYSIVTSGRTLKGEDLKKACKVYKKMRKECDIALCGSHGLLDEEGFKALMASGVTMYHENLEASKRNFPNICTTHTYEEKVACIKLAQRLGLKICSGGIIGMGETWEDRIDMALGLSELKVDSIPINVLMPIKGTPYEGLESLKEEEILRTIAIFRWINPVASIRLAGGRMFMAKSGERAFLSGANGTITGDLLTTCGNNIEEDKDMLLHLGFTIEGGKP